MSNVVFLSYEAGTGGAATYQAQQINYLLSRGRKVILVDERPEFTLAKVRGPLLDQLRVIHAPVWSNASETASAIASLSSTSSGSILALSNPGVLIRHTRALMRAARQDQAKIVITIHSGMLTMTLRRHLLELAASFVCLRLDDIAYVSRFTRHYWELRYPWMRHGRARVVPNGVEIPHHVEPRRALGSLRVGFVGRVLLEKDPALYCQTAHLARQRSLPFEFHLFGDGPLTAELQRMYASDVVWHGQVDDTVAIYASIDILLMTSPVENCPFALLEAKSYGVPVVSPPVGGIVEIVEHGVDGILASCRTAESLVSAVELAHRCYIALNQGCLMTRERFRAERLCEVTWARRGL